MKFMLTSLVNSLLLIALLAACSQKKGEEVSSLNTGSSDDNSIELIRNDEEKKVDVLIDGDVFTSYIYSDTLKKPVLYPIKTASGATITRGFPIDPRPEERTDHPHHIGLWFNYGDVNGLDFWNNSDNIPAERASDYGTIYHKEINKIDRDNEKGELVVTMEWIGPEGGVLLKEQTTFLFRGTVHKRMIDRITHLTALDKDISFKDNKEGMLGMRMARDLEHPDESDGATGMYRSSEGLEGHDVWGSRGRWMNLSGKVDNEHISVVMLDHPDNVGYPTYWHARGYGLYAANPLGQKVLSGGEEELSFNLPIGESVTFKHRIIIYSGKEASDEQVNEDWEEFADSFGSRI